MKLKLARTTLKAKPKTIELKKIEDELANRSIFYFDKDNSHKELKEIRADVQCTASNQLPPLFYFQII